MEKGSTMKKDTFYRILVLSLIIGASACTPQNKPIFEKSASERTAEAMDALQEKLLSSPNGWIGEYYPGTTQYGGYVLSFVFTKEGEAFISSEVLEDMQKPERSQYIVGSDAGVSLNFVTYNKALHFFADPDYRVGGGVSKGFEGDYEFLLMEDTHPDTIFLKGKTKGQILKLFKPKTAASDYLKKSMDTYGIAFNQDFIRENVKDSYAGTLGGKETVLFFGKYNTLYYLDEKGNKIDVPFVPTPEGIRLHTPLNGIEYLVFNVKDKTLTAQGTSLSMREDPNYKYYTEFLGDYTVDANGAVYDVKFEKAGNTRYKITSPQWNYHIYASFDASNRRFTINVQEIETKPGTKLVMWDTNEGYLAWGEEIGVYSEKIDTGDGSVAYKLVDNKVWGGNKADSFYMMEMNSQKEDKSLKPSRIVRPIFKKKQLS